MSKTTASVSVLVPVHDPEGDLSNFLIRLLTSLDEQTLKPMEVVIISNHDLHYEQTLLSSFSSKLNLMFITQDSRGAAENINTGVQACSGQLIKLLFQDDFLCDADALQRQSGLLSGSESNWLVSACNTFDESKTMVSRVHIPRFTNRIAWAMNTIGAPSVVMFYREKFRPFDESLQYVFDCEWYLKMRHNFGEPVVSRTIDVTIGIHDGQATHWARKLLRNERWYMFRKHWVGAVGFSRNCKCSQELSLTKRNARS
jgi:glycosyltransferase involved in cell wall biosynthesis